MKLLSELKEHRIPASLEVGRVLKFTDLRWHHEGLQSEEHEQYITGDEQYLPYSKKISHVVNFAKSRPVPNFASINFHDCKLFVLNFATYFLKHCTEWS